MSVNTHDPSTDFSSLTPPADLSIAGADIDGAVLVVPSDAPLPNEIKDDAASGNLYTRLGPLAGAASASVVPLSGPELLGLVGVWRSIASAKKVYYVSGLPGARYDVTFLGAVRQIGLRQLDWADISEHLARIQAHAQSTGDSQPWTRETTASTTPAKRRFPHRSAATTVDGRTVELRVDDREADTYPDEEGL